MVFTKQGPVEYKRLGTGPVVMMCHGAPGGYDQIIFIEKLIDHGFSVIVPSRPGYLGTPLDSDSFEEEADLFAALLDELDLDKVAILGISAGGPIALHFANRYPEKTVCLVLEAAVTTTYVPADDAEDSFWGRLFLSDGFDDFASWITIGSLRLAFKATFRSLLAVETTYTKSEISEFANLVASDPERKEWIMNLLLSTFPLSQRKIGLKKDLLMLKSINSIPVSNIESPCLVLHSRFDNDVPWVHAQWVVDNLLAELVEVHGGHFLWVGKDKDVVWDRRLNFLEQHLHLSQ